MGEPVEIDTGQADQRAVYDALRARCPVAHEDGAWVVLRHAEVVAAATDPARFSSDVTGRRAIPNSLDGAEHAAYRAVVDRYLTSERVARQEPGCRRHAVAIVDALPRDVTVKTIGGIGVPYAVRSQSSWLGWPAELEAELVAWLQDNHAATRSGDRARTMEVAERFDHLIRTLLDERRDGPVVDVTGELLRETVDGRPLTDEEVVSILRNWTAGDLGSLATSVGVIVHFLAANPAPQRDVRALVEAGDRAGVEAAVEEILRIDDPFIANRRRATRTVELGGETIPEDDRLLLNWTAANRDPLVFGDPDEYDPVGHAAANLVFGIGPHVCPGRELTLMELRVVVEELLARTTWLEPALDRPAVRETPPVGGWARVPVVLR
ncbi:MULTISPECIES: cytochrome P450 [unclassified Nocardioides]|uniref:cytochrome P450 n=1 Tax=unclassified Nocardioides TaxID=2615069 RepID=UPI0000570EB3|nr:MULTISPECIES: cytochrome P450 [unclassified Nocardioides]ABL81381.1 cytochrome P450 [Nocardioides sp. JS614]